MALVQPSQDGSSVVAFVAPLSVDVRALLSWLSEQLPEYMTPRAIYRLKQLPKTTNDKVDHKSVAATSAILLLEGRSSEFDRMSQKPQPQSTLFERPRRMLSTPPIQAPDSAVGRVMSV